MQHKFCSSNKNHHDSHMLPNTLISLEKLLSSIQILRKQSMGNCCVLISFMYCLLSFQHPLQLVWLLGLKGTSSDKIRRRHLEMRRKSEH